jgi:hypothetical protein
MKSTLFGAAISIMAASLAHAQTTPSSTQPNGTTTSPATSTGAPASPGVLSERHDSGKQAASGDTNQAIATTTANADQPAKGHNSFTMKQAATRIAAKGYTDVTGLKKDANGIWRGTGTKDGAAVHVWLDYKGNIGQQP